MFKSDEKETCYQGKEYNSPPKGLIVDAVLRAVYGEANEVARDGEDEYDVPANLRRFFASKRQRKNPGPPRDDSP